MAQTLARIFVHVVFSTKDRAPLLKEPIRPQLFAYLGGIVFSSQRDRHLYGTLLAGKTFVIQGRLLLTGRSCIGACPQGPRA